MSLKGQELINYLQQNEGVDRDTIMKGAGYVCRRNGKESIQKTKFFEALASANGHNLSITPDKGDGYGKEATYRLKVGPKGLIPVSRAYTTQCQMEPGTYVKVSLEDGAIILEPDNEVPETTPVVCGI